METDLREELADLPARRWWTYRLPPALERRFASETDADRNRQIRFWLGVALAISWLTLALDVSTNPDVWWLALLLRACVVTPAFLVARRLLAPARSTSLAGLASAAPLVITVLVTLVMFAVSVNFDILRSAIVQCVMIVWISVIIPLRVRHALAFAVLALALGDAINAAAATWHHTIVDRPDLIVATHMIVVLSVFARVVAERETRRSFLLGLGLQIRADDLARSNARLLELSSTDPLTGLANRRSFDQTMAKAWQDAAVTKSRVALMMIDIDHFKQFNDAAGHLEGDRCLTIIARAIAEQVRRGQDFAGRFGGEEFIVLLPDTRLDRAQEVAERVRTAIAALQLFHPGRSGRSFVSVSIGVAAMQPSAPGATSAKLIAAADEALYLAKAGGRDRVVWADRRARDAEAAA